MSDASSGRGRWRARWIWCEPPALRYGSGPLPAPVLDEAAAARVGAFRKTIQLDRVPPSVPARVTADSRYILWVNGVEASRGPIRAAPSKLYYDTVDLAPLLRRGVNTFAMLARFYGRPMPWWAPSRPMAQLGAGAVILEAHLASDAWLITDGSWRVLPLTGWSSLPPRGVGGMGPDIVDAGGEPAGWKNADFDDSDWAPALELMSFHVGFQGRHEPPSQPYGAMLPRPFPRLRETMRAGKLVGAASIESPGLEEHPVDQVAGDASKASFSAPANDAAAFDVQPGRVQILRYDFGEVVCGTLELDVDAPGGTRFDLSASEFAAGDAVPGGEQMQLGLRYTARGRDDRFESFDPLGFRYATLAIRGDGRVHVRDLSVRERLYPRPEGPFFECSDAALNDIWRAGRRTVDLNSHDAYLDCPTREQRAWTGDFVVHQMVDFASNPDWGLALHNLELAAAPRADGMLPMAAAGDIAHQDLAYIPDWALHWIRALHNVYRYAGNRDLVRRLLPVAENVLRWFLPYQADDGLLADVNGWVLIDWSAVTVEGRSASLNGLFARALLDFAEMSHWLDDVGRAGWATEVWSRVHEGFEAFWDERRRLYADNIAGGARGRAVSENTQAAAICGQLVPRERLAALVSAMTDSQRRVHAAWSVPSGDARHPGAGEGGIGGVYLMTGPPAPWWDVDNQIVVAQPFFRYVVHDAVALAGRADLIAHLCRDWKDLLERCPTTLSEAWFGGTTCHGWSATPTRDLLVRTLGITPAQPGFVTARIAPRLGDLEWARGAAPTPAGLLSVAVTREHVRVESPVPYELDIAGQTVTMRPPGCETFRTGGENR